MPPRRSGTDRCRRRRAGFWEPCFLGLLGLLFGSGKAALGDPEELHHVLRRAGGVHPCAGGGLHYYGGVFG